ncbi:UbiA family prenyltransferase [Streptomyces sp. NPDC002133]|uniref:UbiA family prenyltransferase n=1 Tax=Streptomyces sp. NPDC002133 TaxID=3154409 RepID=UPI0033180D9E
MTPSRTARSDPHDSPDAPAAPATVPCASPGRPVRGLLAACHPAPAAAVTVLTAALVAAVGGHDLLDGATTVCAVAAGQLSIGWCNDRADLVRDRTARRADKPLTTGLTSPRAVATAAGAALAVCVPLSLACGLLAGCVHLVSVAAAWAYNLRLKRTIASWVPYALAFGLLPAFVTLGLAGAPWPPLWLTTAAALLGTGAHFANVLPDIDHDLAAGVNGLPQRLGGRRSGPVAAFLVLAASLVLVFAPAGPVSASGRAVAAVTTLLCVVAVARPSGRAGGRVPFLATMGIAGIDVTQLLLRGAELG